MKRIAALAFEWRGIDEALAGIGGAITEECADIESFDMSDGGRHKDRRRSWRIANSNLEHRPNRV
jgi:hypothetical protein